MPKNLFKTLPDEILLNIFANLPPLSFTGPNKINLVSQKFNAIANDQTLESKKTKKALMESCKNNLTEALTVLSDEAYFSLLTLEEITTIAFHHFEIAEQIIFIPELVNNLGTDKIVKLGQMHLGIAEHILNGNMLKGHGLASVSKCHPTIAKQILNSPLADELNGYYLALISKQTIELANRVLNTPNFANKLDTLDLQILGENHVDIAEDILEKLGQENNPNFNNVLFNFGLKHLTIAEYILNTPHLMNINRFDKLFVGSLINNHIALAERILNTPALTNKLDPVDLTDLGKNHLVVAENILKNPALVDRLNRCNLTALGEKHITIAEHILNTPHLVKKLNQYDLKSFGIKHLAIAEHFLNTSQSENPLVNFDLATFSEYHITIAERFLDTPQLASKLKGYHLAEFVQNLQNHPTLVERVLSTPELVNKLDGRHFVKMSRNQRVAKLILNTPELANKLDGNNLATISQTHFTIAERVLNTPKLVDKLEGHHLVKMGQHHRALIKRILNSPELSSKLIGCQTGTLLFANQNYQSPKEIEDAMKPLTNSFIAAIQSISKKLLIEKKPLPVIEQESLPYKRTSPRSKTEIEKSTLWSWENKHNEPSPSQQPRKRKRTTDNLQLPPSKKPRLN